MLGPTADQSSPTTALDKKIADSINGRQQSEGHSVLRGVNQLLNCCALTWALGVRSNLADHFALRLGDSENQITKHRSFYYERSFL
jgi:hypothetical protein